MSHPPSAAALPEFAAVLDAAARIAPHARLTPILRDEALDALSGATLHFKAEHLQRGGAFKFRGACNAVWALPDELAARGVLTHSSGNHGAALALAAASRGIAAHVVVPDGAVRTKLALIEAAGAHVHRCAPTLAAREAACVELMQTLGTTLIHPYENPQVIAGQGTVALELLHALPDLDALVVPIGGGGLAAGSALSLQALAPRCELVLAEPEGASDAAQSLRSGARVTAFTPHTICDGLRAGIGAPNFALLRAAGAGVITVSDAETRAAMRLLWQHLKQTVEPSSATVLAAVLQQRARFAGRRVGLILSGGNVDLDAIAFCARCGGG
ncbi:MAG: pyridoxal-phosphate dependent enzyme [Metallibacterium scheffleri]